MGDAFRSWKRKLGVVTLLMTCVFMGAWIRGYSVKDVVTIGNDHLRYHHELAFSDAGIAWFRTLMNDNVTREPGWYAWNQTSTFDPSDHFSFCTLQTSSDPRDDEWRVVHYRRRWLGFDAGKLSNKNAPTFQTTWLLFPYWSIITPLTLLSMYLLLTKPNQTIQRATVEASSSRDGRSEW